MENDQNNSANQFTPPAQPPQQTYQPAQPPFEFNEKTMKHCKSCGAPIAKKAKRCPQCGAKNKKPLFKKPIFWILIIVVVGIIGAASANGGDDTKPSKAAPSNQSSLTSEAAKSDSKTTEKTTEETTEKVLSESEYKAQCKTVNYKDLARNPDSFEGQYMKFTGEVIQVQEGSSGWLSSPNVYRIAVTKDDWGYSSDDVVYVTFEMPEGASRILEDDIVTFYGVCTGLYTYTSVLGSTVSVPSVEAQYIDIVE